eukprot:TRINITY_DN35837_c0_g1_i1.p1 TRINITY_DN35837_c0_g1~~TRINITY_DN35837_c0_g1_i1.p1  ORF type:complete len:350 (+),score=78.22 TRINITY_DN35837_c0_g1_i1:190-1239(+)
MASVPVKVGRKKLGSQGFEVSEQGLGCMGMSAFYGAAKEESEMVDLMRKAVDLGITFFDTSDVYGPHTNEVLVGKALKGIRDKVQLATKYGISYSPETGPVIKGDPGYVRSCCEASLKRLDVDCIDLYYQHRVDKSVPIEVTIGAMKQLVEEGKIKYIGLSEASADTIRRAHAVHPITAVQLEWSLWTRDCEEDIIPLCRELDIGIVPYSPLGRGFFSGKAVVEELEAGDWRRMNPRFQNLEKNKVLYERVAALAAKKGCTPGQLALGWVQQQGADVVPIPGTTKAKNLEENIACLNVPLSAEELNEIAAAVPFADVVGERYPEGMSDFTWKLANTPPLSSWDGPKPGL